MNNSSSASGADARRDSRERGTTDTAKCVSVQQLFGTHRELVILHGDVQYKLRITRHNKLILTK